MFTFSLPLPLYAQKGGGFGGRGFGGRGSGGRGGDVGLGIRLPWFRPPSSDISDLSPVAEGHGVLLINITTKDAEIYIDGRFIGRARGFKGPVMVSVPKGEHLVEFRDSSFQAADIDVVPGSTVYIVR